MIAFFVLFCSALIDFFFTVKIAENLFSMMEYIVLASLGIVIAEKLQKPKEVTDSNPEHSFFTSMILDIDNHISSKRVITLFSFLYILTIYLGSMFFQFTYTSHILDGMQEILYAGLGTAFVEKLPLRRSE